MSTLTVEQLAPLLVSDLPPYAPVTPGPVIRLLAAVRRRAVERRFERALRQAVPGEYGDLLAAARRT